MRFAIDAWAPEYGSAVDLELEQSDAVTDVGVELAAGEWRPIEVAPGTPRPDAFLFVDGVQRVEARVWVTDDSGGVHPGLCVSYAAGVMRCADRVTLEQTCVERRFLCAAPGAIDIVPPHGVPFQIATPSASTPAALTLALHQRRGELEARVTHDAKPSANEIVIVDGRLLPAHGRGAVGSVKTQHKSYGPDEILQTESRLGVGQRTPLFVLGDAFTRFTWYVRLPCDIDFPLAGIVRCEASTDVGVAEAIVRADQVTAALPRFASMPYRDSRAPQNLNPIASLERELRRRLGDPAVVHRALREAARAA